MDSDGQSGDFNTSREVWVGSLKHWLGLENDSFGSLLVLVWVVSCSQGLCYANSTAFPLLHKVSYNRGLYTIMVWLISSTTGILLSMLYLVCR